MGKKDRRAEIPDKKARKTAAAAKEEAKEHKEVPKIKGCHVSVDVSGGCIRPKDPVPVANAADGVKMACSNHHCPFASAFSVHKDCFQKLTDKVVSMLLRTGQRTGRREMYASLIDRLTITGSSSWTDEQRVENAWRRKGLTFVGKFISCPCGHGTQTLEDSENRWSRVGEVVLDPKAYEKNREEKIKKQLGKHDKPTSTQPKSINTTFGGREQAMLARKLERQEWERENGLARGDSAYVASASTASSAGAKKQKTASPASFGFTYGGSPTDSSPATIDDDGFTAIGKDGRAREMTPASPTFPGAAAPFDRKSIQPLRSIVCPPPANFMGMSVARGERGRTISTGSNTSWLTSSTTNPPPPPQREKRRGGDGGAGRERPRTGRGVFGDRNKENQRRGSSCAPKKTRGAFTLLSGSEDEDEEEERMESPNLQSMMKNMRDFVEEFHSYSGIGLWSMSEVKEINQHLALFMVDSANFQCSITGRTLKEPTILTQLTPATSWIFTTSAMSFKIADIPPGTQLTLQEYYAIYHNYEVKHLDDPIIWCRDGTQALLECSEMTMLTLGK